MPHVPWEDLSMYFILGLPWIVGDHNSIFVVEDQSSLMTHFIRHNKTVDTSWVAKLFMKEVRFHGMPKIFISYRDIKFAIYFQKIL